MTNIVEKTHNFIMSKIKEYKPLISKLDNEQIEIIDIGGYDSFIIRKNSLLYCKHSEYGNTLHTYDYSDISELQFAINCNSYNLTRLIEALKNIDIKQIIEKKLENEKRWNNEKLKEKNEYKANLEKLLK